MQISPKRRRAGAPRAYPDDGIGRWKENIMSAYIRFTRECSFGQLRPELVRAIREYAQNHRELGNVEVEALMCCETTSEKKSTGALAALLGDDPDTILYTGMLVTPQWLIWARNGDQSGSVVSSAKLQDVQVRAFASRLVKDTGMQVSGYVGNSKGRVRGYIGMGPEPAAQKFCEQVQKAIEKASPKPAKKRRLWFLQ
jgi:hypothetical protein